MKKQSFLIFILFLLSNYCSFAQDYFDNKQTLEFIPTVEVFSQAGKLFSYNFSRKSLLMSSNQGNSWELMQHFDTLSIEGIAVWDTTVYVLLRNSASDIFRLATFSVNNNPLGMIVCNGLQPGAPVFIVKDGILFAGIKEKVYKSTDNGLHWVDSSNGLYLGSIISNCGNGEWVYELYADGATLFAGTNCHGVYYSADNGANWYPGNTGIPINTGIPWTSGARVSDIASNTTKLYAITSKGVFYSVKPGLVWVQDTRIPATAKNIEMNNNHCVIMATDGIFI